MSSDDLPKTCKQKLSTREWCLIIAILSLVQFFIHWVAYQFGDSPNALGYVSFAGTLVSIMLGLIAIIYSFVQSISQNNSVVEIRDQVERLIVAGSEISESGKIIHSASQEVNELIGDLVYKVTENTSATKEVFGSFDKITSALSLTSLKQNKDTSDASAGERLSEKDSILDSHRILTSIMILWVNEGARRGLTVDEAEERFSPKLSKALGFSADFLSGAYNATLFALEAERHIHLTDEGAGGSKLDMSDEFNLKLKELVPESMSGEDKLLTSFWIAVNEVDS